jgi:hypothetical protein
MVGHRRLSGDLDQPIPLKPDNDKLARKMRTIDIGDLDTAIAIQISYSGRCKPAVALSNWPCRRPSAIRIIDRQHGTAGHVGLDDDHLGPPVLIQIGQARLDILEDAGLGQPQASTLAVGQVNLQCGPLDRISQHAMVVSGRGLDQGGAYYHGLGCGGTGKKK